jgi:hypothetical protein
MMWRLEEAAAWIARTQNVKHVLEVELPLTLGLVGVTVVFIREK